MMPNGKDCGGDGSGAMTQNFGQNVSGSESAPFSSAVSGMLGQQQQSYNPAANQTLSSSQQPFSSTPVTTGSTGSTGSTVTGSSVPTSGGSTGTSIPTSGGSTGTSLGGGSGNGTTSTSTNASSTSPSAWDQLLSMANGDQNTNTNTNDNQNGTTTPVDLNNNLDNSTGLAAQNPADGTIVVPPVNPATLHAGNQSGQTFVSQDMTDQPSVAPQPTTFGSSMLGGILQKLKLMLINILDQLKPLLVPFYTPPLPASQQVEG
jgi:hypothetical protein